MSLDQQDIVNMVADFADTDGARAAKLAAIEHNLATKWVSDEDGNSGSFTVTHKGIKYKVTDISVNLDGDRYHESGTFWDYNEQCCRVLRTSGYTRMCHNYYIFAMSAKALAEEILNLMDDGRNCMLCGALFPGMKGHAICSECALSELPKKCFTCGKIHGRNAYPQQSTERPEHPVCKRRRLQ